MENYFRIYETVSSGEKIYTIQLVAEKIIGSGILSSVGVDLYDVIVEKKEARSPITPAESAVSTSVVTGSGSASNISIQEMLNGDKIWMGVPPHTRG